MKLMKLLIIVDSSYVGYCQSADTGVATDGDTVIGMKWERRERIDKTVF